MKFSRGNSAGVKKLMNKLDNGRRSGRTLNAKENFIQSVFCNFIFTYCWHMKKKRKKTFKKIIYAICMASHKRKKIIK